MPGTLLRCLLLSCFVCLTSISLTAEQTLRSTNRTAAELQPLNLGDQVVSFRHSNPPAIIVESTEGSHVIMKINGDRYDLDPYDGRSVIPVDVTRKGKLYLIEVGSNQGLYHIAQTASGYRFRKIPLWLSIMPPLIAILLALVFREVLVSLFVGIWVGSFIAGGLRVESVYHIFLSLFQTVSKYIVEALNDFGHISVVVFSLLIGAMVAVISKNGGMAGVVERLSHLARTPRSTQFVTWLLGVAIFFDDYANTLIVGNTMRSVTDRFNVSREKLAYIVDSTAAPVAAIAFITTWIGAELGYIDTGMATLDDFPYEITTYALFIGSLKYSFYPLLTLIFILMLVYLRRDFGPMFSAEQRSFKTGQLMRSEIVEQQGGGAQEFDPVPDAPLRWYNAVIPVAAVILLTVFGLLQTGFESTFNQLVESGVAITSADWAEVWRQMPLLMDEESGFFMKVGLIVGNSDSYTALLWASITGVIVAVVLSISQRITSIMESMRHVTMGIETMMPAILILTLAWALAITTQELHTADYLSAILTGTVNPYFMPTLVFILSALIAFSTGSSWSTMAILYPIAIPTTWSICMAEGYDPQLSLEILLNVISTVLAASVLGDHCSPISDTTILSSLASQCNHIDHVRTQLPYAITVGSVALVAGTASTFLGGGWLISFVLLLVSLMVLFGVILRFGRNPRKHE